MTTFQALGSCLGVPIDHRLKPLLGTGLTPPGPFLGSKSHAQAIVEYGRRLQKHRKDISNDEINFANWLAMPGTTGGVVIVLLQPAKHQRYFSDPHQTVKDCDTLAAVDEVCKVVTGHGLAKISCFDAFPFHKIPVDENPDAHKKSLDEAHDIFLHMIEQKQPKVVFSCFRSPHFIHYRTFHCIGVGRTRDFQVPFKDRRYTCVNGFHPSYAINHREDNSALRSLFTIELAHAFRQANGTWKTSDWMKDVRKRCADIFKADEKGKIFF
jgi:hypothetical protein